MQPQTTYRSLRGLASLSISSISRNPGPTSRRVTGTVTTTTSAPITSSLSSSFRPTLSRFSSSFAATNPSSLSPRYNSPALSSPRRPGPTTLRHMSFFKKLFSFSAPSPEAMAKAAEKVQKLIDENNAIVFSKSYCPYCRSTKGTLNSLGADYKVIELDQESDGAELQDALQEISGQRTVPNVYIAKKHIGGNSDVQALNSKDELVTLLKEAGAIASKL